MSRAAGGVRPPGGSVGDIKAASLGGAFGLASAFMVTHALLEITYNSYFAVMFATLFLFIGGLIVQRAVIVSKEGSPPGNNNNNNNSYTRLMLVGLASLILLSSIFCICIDAQWALRLPYALKVPMYTLLGLSISFLLVFALVDCLNFYCETLSNRGGPGFRLVRNNAQVGALIAGSFLVGLLFGFFYGFFDIEDVNSVRLIRDRYVCVPIAVLIGSVTSVAVRRLGAADDLEGRRRSHSPPDVMEGRKTAWSPLV